MLVNGSPIHFCFWLQADLWLGCDIRPLCPRKQALVQAPSAADLVTGKARSGLHYMGATAVSALPSRGVRSNLKLVP